MAATNPLPADWGVRPVLFHIGDQAVSSYAVFMGLGVLTGIAVYIYESRRKGRLNENGLLIAVGSLIGGVLGAKLLEWLINYRYVLDHLSNWPALLSGRTIVGGLIGGTIGVMVTKKLLKIKDKRGNLFAPAVAIGVVIGRIGCLLRGCCYGKATTLPWGVNFGDGVMRHPTQIYEALFMLAMFIWLQRVKDRPDVKPGQLFNRLMVAYFSYRFLVEFIKAEPAVFFHLTVFQYISVGVIIYLLRDRWLKLFSKRQTYARIN